MASAASKAAVASLRGRSRADRREPQDIAISAWAWALPCAAVAAVVIALLGPPLGGLLVPAQSPYRFVGNILTGLHPEATEQGRYVLAASVPLVAALVLAAVLPRQASTHALRPLAVATQVALALVVAASIVAQYRFQFGLRYTRGFQPTFTMHYFTPATLAVGAAVALASALWPASVVQRTRRALFDESRTRRAVVAGLAAAATAAWMLHAVHTDAEIGNAIEDVRYHMGFTLDETFAVINGRTPLVNFTAQYGSLWPFVLALPVIAFGKTLLAFSIAACAASALALLAVFGVLRRAVRSSTTALLLYLPFLATSLFRVGGTLQNRSSAGSYYASFPLRYALPYFVAWLAAWRLERGRGGRADWLLFTVAGLAVLNNVDFGAAAFGASVAALLWSGPPTRQAVARTLGWALAGAATALALVSLLTLIRAGALPQVGRLVSYARMYALGGFAQMPIPGVLGVHLLGYLTYVAAIFVATVRALRQAENRVLTGMLAWAGVFGLGAGAYYAGRSHPVALVYEFSAWALALALLTPPALAALRERQRRAVTAIGSFLVLFGFGVMACSLAQTPTPWEQLARLQAPFVPSERMPDANPLAASPDPEVRRFVQSLADGPRRFVVRRGAPVAILLANGHRIADAYGLVDVTPYTGIDSLQTAERIRETVDALRRAGGNTIILPDPIDPLIMSALGRMGFYDVTQKGLQPFRPVQPTLVQMPWPGLTSIFKWVDRRHPRAPALDRLEADAANQP
ncbi:MAG TPA: hypothetical protein VFS37_10765 [Conexibacter sp.]|nr:hypothetical protein [Conexibacter sp.]